jgi:small redox-active disulfide protein 2
MKIEILGPGCSRCRATEEIVRQALAEMSLEAEIVHLKDPVEMAKRRVLLTPAMIVDGHLFCSGRVPSVSEVKSWLGEARAA